MDRWAIYTIFDKCLNRLVVDPTPEQDLILRAMGRELNEQDYEVRRSDLTLLAAYCKSAATERENSQNRVNTLEEPDATLD